MLSHRGFMHIHLSQSGLVRRSFGVANRQYWMQIRFLESKGFVHVGEWPFEAASKMIGRISANGWRIPAGVVPPNYKPEE